MQFPVVSDRVRYATWLDIFNVTNFCLIFLALVVFAVVHYRKCKEKTQAAKMDEQPLLGGKQPILWSQKIDQEMRWIVPVFYLVLIAALFIPAWLSPSAVADQAQVLPDE